MMKRKTEMVIAYEIEDGMKKKYCYKGNRARMERKNRGER